MFLLFSLVWSIVVVQQNPPAVGEAETEVLTRKYIDIVTSYKELQFTDYTGSALPGHNVQRTAEVAGVGTVYETLLTDHTRRITLLVGDFLSNVEAGLTHFKNLYDQEFKRASRLLKATTQLGQQTNGWRDRVTKVSLDPKRNLVPLNADAKTALQTYVCHH